MVRIVAPIIAGLAVIVVAVLQLWCSIFYDCEINTAHQGCGVTVASSDENNLTFFDVPRLGAKIRLQGFNGGHRLDIYDVDTAGTPRLHGSLNNATAKEFNFSGKQFAVGAHCTNDNRKALAKENFKVFQADSNGRFSSMDLVSCIDGVSKFGPCEPKCASALKNNCPSG